MAGLRTESLWAAPGVDADFPDGDRWADLVPDLPFRVALLPTVPRTGPFPGLMPAVRAAFPGELVVLAHGTWLEVGGPGQQEVESARNYALGAYETQLLSTDVSQRQITAQFLERLGELRFGEAFRRPPVEPTTDVPPLDEAAPMLAGTARTAQAYAAGMRGHDPRRTACSSTTSSGTAQECAGPHPGERTHPVLPGVGRSGPEVVRAAIRSRIS